MRQGKKGRGVERVAAGARSSVPAGDVGAADELCGELRSRRRETSSPPSPSSRVVLKGNEGVGAPRTEPHHEVSRALAPLNGASWPLSGRAARCPPARPPAAARRSRRRRRPVHPHGAWQLDEGVLDEGAGTGAGRLWCGQRVGTRCREGAEGVERGSR